MKKILVMGLPGAGKTYFAERLKKYLETHSDFYNSNFENLHASKATVKWINADDVRKKFPDMVVVMPNGYDAVNYAGLGIEMIEV